MMMMMVMVMVMATMAIIVVMAVSTVASVTPMPPTPRPPQSLDGELNVLNTELNSMEMQINGGGGGGGNNRVGVGWRQQPMPSLPMQAPPPLSPSLLPMDGVSTLLPLLVRQQQQQQQQQLLVALLSNQMMQQPLQSQQQPLLTPLMSLQLQQQQQQQQRQQQVVVGDSTLHQAMNEAKEATHIRDSLMRQAAAARQQRDDAMAATQRILTFASVNVPQQSPPSPPQQQQQADSRDDDVQVVNHNPHKVSNKSKEHPLSSRRGGPGRHDDQHSSNMSNANKSSESSPSIIPDPGIPMRERPIDEKKQPNSEQQQEEVSPPRFEQRSSKWMTPTVVHQGTIPDQPHDAEMIRFREMRTDATPSLPSSSTTTAKPQLMLAVKQRDAALTEMKSATGMIANLLHRVHTLERGVAPSSSSSAAAAPPPPPALPKDDISAVAVQRAHMDLAAVGRVIRRLREDDADMKGRGAVLTAEATKAQRANKLLSAKGQHAVERIEDVLKQADTVHGEQVALVGARAALTANEKRTQAQVHAARVHIEELLSLMHATHAHFLDTASSAGNSSAALGLDVHTSQAAVKQVRHAYEVIAKSAANIKQLEQRIATTAATSSDSVRRDNVRAHALFQRQAMLQATQAATVIQGLLAKLHAQQQARTQKQAEERASRSTPSVMRFREIYTTTGGGRSAPATPSPPKVEVLGAIGQPPLPPRTPTATLPPRFLTRAFTGDVNSNDEPTKVRVNIGAPIYSTSDTPRTSSSPAQPPRQSQRHQVSSLVVRHDDETIVHHHVARAPAHTSPDSLLHHHHRRRRHHSRHHGGGRPSLEAWMNKWDDDWATEAAPLLPSPHTKRRHPSLSPPLNCAHRKCGRKRDDGDAAVKKLTTLMDSMHLARNSLPTTIMSTRLAPYHYLPANKLKRLATIIPGTVVEGKHHDFMPLRVPSAPQKIRQLLRVATAAIDSRLAHTHTTETALIASIPSSAKSFPATPPLSAAAAVGGRRRRQRSSAEVHRRARHAYIVSGRLGLQLVARVQRVLRVMQETGLQPSHRGAHVRKLLGRLFFAATRAAALRE